MVIRTFSDKKENSGEVFLSQCLFAFADHIHADLKQPPPPHHLYCRQRERSLPPLTELLLLNDHSFHRYIHLYHTVYKGYSVWHLSAILLTLAMITHLPGRFSTLWKFYIKVNSFWKLLHCIFKWLLRPSCTGNQGVSLVKHFCPWLELAQVVAGRHTRCQSTARHTESSGQHRPKTTHKEIVHHTQLQQEVKFTSERQLMHEEFSFVCYH